MLFMLNLFLYVELLCDKGVVKGLRCCEKSMFFLLFELRCIEGEWEKESSLLVKMYWDWMKWF